MVSEKTIISCKGDDISLELTSLLDSLELLMIE